MFLHILSMNHGREFIKQICSFSPTSYTFQVNRKTVPKVLHLSIFKWPDLWKLLINFSARE